MAVKLHRCGNLWIKLGAHPCWRVQRELDQAGVDYAIVPGPLRRSKRDALEHLSGQRLYPVIEFDDGTVYREESKEMAEAIKSGRLMEKRAGGPTSQSHEGHHHGRDQEHAGPPA